MAAGKTNTDYLAEIRQLKAKHARDVKATQDDHMYVVRRHAEKAESLQNELEGYKLAATAIKEENKRLVDQVERMKPHEREVYRLQGVLDGLERAGKIDPSPRVYDPTLGTHADFMAHNRR